MLQRYDYDSNRPAYFLHIPKTAGTTFRVLLENQFPVSRICRTYHFFGMKRFDEAELETFRLYRGHMGYNLVNYLPVKPYTLAMFRDPLERAISHFEHIRRDPTHPKHDLVLARGMSLKDYLKDEELSRDLTNSQTKPLSHDYDRQALKRLLGESGNAEDFARRWEQGRKEMDAGQMLELALERLEGLDFVGISEQLDRSMELASWLFFAPAPDALQALNTNPGRIRAEELDDETLELLNSRLELDRKLYGRARELFEAEYALLEERERSEAYRERWQSRPFLTELEYTFDEPLRGSGWHQRELLPGRGLFRWTGPGTRSSFDVRLQPGGDYRLQVDVVAQAEEGLLDRLQLSFNGDVIDFDIQQLEGEGWVLSAVIPARLLDSQECCSRLLFELPGTAVISKREGRALHSGNRPVGIAVIGIHFFPLDRRRLA